MTIKYNNRHRIICNRLLRASNVCALCLKPFLKRKDASIDHVIPLSKGGPDVPTNMQLAHPWCNSRKGNGTKEENECGWYKHPDLTDEILAKIKQDRIDIEKKKFYENSRLTKID